VRVIAGTARGRHLKGGGERGVRPTSDLVRGAIFDMLSSMNADLSVEKALTKLTGKYSLILADPPYADEASEGVLQQVAESSLVTPQTVMVLEHSKRQTSAPALGPLPLMADRRHGDTVISIYRSGGE
jgi:16S rRNA G966 N2-methylase RsmD